MAAQHYPQTGLIKYLSLNNSELTVGGSSIDVSESLNISDVETSAGRIKRFYKKNNKSLSISYSYIPSSSDKTVDGRQGRDFIYNLASSAPYVLVSYKDNPNGEVQEFYGYIDSYSDTVVRRDMQSQCIYYDLTFDIMEA
ncbi:MAG: hypothetical protein ACO397_05945 [Gammaproteobacteria bacterium]